MSEQDAWAPQTVAFYDCASEREMLLRWWGTPPEPWLFFWHPDGHWVSQRRATVDDLLTLLGPPDESLVFS